MQTSQLRRPPAPLAGDDLEDRAVVRMLADQQRLKDAALPHGVHEALDRLRIEFAPWLEAARGHEFDG